MTPSLLPPDMDDRIVAACAHLPLAEGLVDYLRYGLPPGSFLQAVLSNDLYEAVRRADAPNRAALADYVQVLANYAPIDAWGDREMVRAWVRQGKEVRAGLVAARAITDLTGVEP